MKNLRVKSQICGGFLTKRYGMFFENQKSSTFGNLRPQVAMTEKDILMQEFS